MALKPEEKNHVDFPTAPALFLAVASGRAECDTVVCAAGNDSESQLIYPACLAAEDNGIIAVGAVTAEGYRSGHIIGRKMFR